jgi:hypothetical protein
VHAFSFPTHIKHAELPADDVEYIWNAKELQKWVGSHTRAWLVHPIRDGHDLPRRLSEHPASTELPAHQTTTATELARGERVFDSPRKLAGCLTHAGVLNID